MKYLLLLKKKGLFPEVSETAVRNICTGYKQENSSRVLKPNILAGANLVAVIGLLLARFTQPFVLCLLSKLPSSKVIFEI